MVTPFYLLGHYETQEEQKQLPTDSREGHEEKPLLLQFLAPFAIFAAKSLLSVPEFASDPVSILCRCAAPQDSCIRLPRPDGTGLTIVTARPRLNS